ncbi:MAG TPA: AAA family ATPase, partial [Burkholderiales bacterium]|nr:AAA family ATPase [Burkholderiales bacterium]
MAAYQLNLLGGFELRTSGGELVRLPTRKAEALLAYLALAPRSGHARDTLTGLLWGESSDRSARASLRQTLFLIGKSFNRDTLVTEGRTVALAPGALDVDVVEFERCSASGDIEALNRAAGLYRGELLAGLALNEPAFEEWLLAERERLRERAIEATVRLVTAFGESSGDQAIQAALRLTALDPLEESAHRALMRLYANAGRRAAALRQYQSCVGILQRELAAEPAPETQALYRDILQRPTQPSRSPPVRPVAPLFPTVAADGGPISSTPPPIGRARELLQLRETIESARQGRGGVVLILGEAGIGKTTILTSVAAEAASLGACVLLGHSYESDQILPFAPWVDAVQMGGVLSGESIQELEPIWRAELTRLFPELQRPDLPVPSGDQRRLFESVVRFVERLAVAAPLVILLEDLHWADEMSTRLLAFLARRIRDKAVLLIGTAREEDLADALPLRRALEELRLEPHFARMPLAPLSAVDTAILVQSLRRSGADPVAETRLADRIWKMSEGNPFVAVETLRALAEGHLAAATTG